MHVTRTTAVAAVVLAITVLLTPHVAAGNRDNPDGYGIYSPLDRKGSAYRYDPRSWYYSQPGYYPYYGSNYWVPRASMRYRYRYLYYGPKYRYYPAWGYPRDGDNSGGHHWGW
jgi:hypothetical protein